MSQRHDFIPRPDAEFNDWFGNLVDYVDEKASGTSPVWDHIPKRHVNDLDAAYTDWNSYYLPPLQPHTPAAVTAKNDARRRCSKVLRTFELGVCASRKLHTFIHGVLRSKTPKLSGAAG